MVLLSSQVLSEQSVQSSLNFLCQVKYESQDFTAGPAELRTCGTLGRSEEADLSGPVVPVDLT